MIHVLAVAVAGILFSVGLLAAGRAFLVTTVDGSSMEPTLQAGDRLLVRRTERPGRDRSSCSSTRLS